MEIKETFHDFASSMSNNQQEEEFYIQKDDLQEAYIRLLNRHVGWDLIKEELDKNDDYDPNFKEFTLSEFRNIYYRSVLSKLTCSGVVSHQPNPSNPTRPSISCALLE